MRPGSKSESLSFPLSMSRSVYLDYRGVFPLSVTFSHPPSDFRFVLEIPKIAATGAHRGDAELLRVAKDLLHRGLHESVSEVLINFRTPREIERERFGKMAKRVVYSSAEGTIYEVIQEKGNSSNRPTLGSWK
jgi:hypothetical protein